MDRQLELIATTTFGVEAVVKWELTDLGFPILRTENGKVTFSADSAGLARANLWLRSADRVLVKTGEFRAVTFDELFEATAAIPWEDYVAPDGKFTVNGKSVKSTLFSISDCQAIVKKAIARRLGKAYGTAWLPETGAEHTVLVSLLSDVATLTIDASGTALHKRGYRQNAVTAPLKETLAAALVQLSYWNADRVLHDVFCGSGTIPIEAALIGHRMAPGLNRDFDACHWHWMEKAVWEGERKKAREAVLDRPLKIFASDIDGSSLEAARENARAAGLPPGEIVWEKKDFREMDFREKYGVLITNPPYGERLSDPEAIPKLYADMEDLFSRLDTWSIYVLTAFPGFSSLKKRQSDRVRKLYNGNIETLYHQFQGPKPPWLSGRTPE